MNSTNDLERQNKDCSLSYNLDPNHFILFQMLVHEALGHGWSTMKGYDSQTFGPTWHPIEILEIVE